MLPPPLPRPPLPRPLPPPPLPPPPLPRPPLPRPPLPRPPLSPPPAAPPATPPTLRALIGRKLNRYAKSTPHFIRKKRGQEIPVGTVHELPQALCDTWFGGARMGRMGMQGDGSCFFHALAAAINFEGYHTLTPGAQREAVYKLRRLCADTYTREHYDKDVEFMRSARNTFEEVMTAWRWPYAWVNELIIQHVLRILPLNIVFTNMNTGSTMCLYAGKNAFKWAVRQKQLRDSKTMTIAAAAAAAGGAATVCRAPRVNVAIRGDTAAELRHALLQHAHACDSAPVPPRSQPPATPTHGSDAGMAAGGQPPPRQQQFTDGDEPHAAASHATRRAMPNVLARVMARQLDVSHPPTEGTTTTADASRDVVVHHPEHTVFVAWVNRRHFELIVRIDDLKTGLITTLFDAVHNVADTRVVETFMRAYVDVCASKGLMRINGGALRAKSLASAAAARGRRRARGDVNSSGERAHMRGGGADMKTRDAAELAARDDGVTLATKVQVHAATTSASHVRTMYADTSDDGVPVITAAAAAARSAFAATNPFNRRAPIPAPPQARSAAESVDDASRARPDMRVLDALASITLAEDDALTQTCPSGEVRDTMSGVCVVAPRETKASLRAVIASGKKGRTLVAARSAREDGRDAGAALVSAALAASAGDAKAGRVSAATRKLEAALAEYATTTRSAGAATSATDRRAQAQFARARTEAAALRSACNLEVSKLRAAQETLSRNIVSEFDASRAVVEATLNAASAAVAATGSGAAATLAAEREASAMRLLGSVPSAHVADAASHATLFNSQQMLAMTSHVRKMAQDTQAEMLDAATAAVQARQDAETRMTQVLAAAAAAAANGGSGGGAANLAAAAAAMRAEVDAALERETRLMADVEKATSSLMQITQQMEALQQGSESTHEAAARAMLVTRAATVAPIVHLAGLVSRTAAQYKTDTDAALEALRLLVGDALARVEADTSAMRVLVSEVAAARDAEGGIKNESAHAVALAGLTRIITEAAAARVQISLQARELESSFQVALAELRGWMRRVVDETPAEAWPHALTPAEEGTLPQRSMLQTEVKTAYMIVDAATLASTQLLNELRTALQAGVDAAAAMVSSLGGKADDDDAGACVPPPRAAPDAPDAPDAEEEGGVDNDTALQGGSWSPTLLPPPPSHDANGDGIDDDLVPPPRRGRGALVRNPLLPGALATVLTSTRALAPSVDASARSAAARAAELMRTASQNSSVRALLDAVAGVSPVDNGADVTSILLPRFQAILRGSGFPPSTLHAHAGVRTVAAAIAAPSVYDDATLDHFERLYVRARKTYLPLATGSVLLDGCNMVTCGRLEDALSLWASLSWAELLAEYELLPPMLAVVAMQLAAAVLMLRGIVGEDDLAVAGVVVTAANMANVRAWVDAGEALGAQHVWREFSQPTSDAQAASFALVELAVEAKRALLQPLRVRAQASSFRGADAARVARYVNGTGQLEPRDMEAALADPHAGPRLRDILRLLHTPSLVEAADRVDRSPRADEEQQVRADEEARASAYASLRRPSFVNEEMLAMGDDDETAAAAAEAATEEEQAVAAAHARARGLSRAARLMYNAVYAYANGLTLTREEEDVLEQLMYESMAKESGITYGLTNLF